MVKTIAFVGVLMALCFGTFDDSTFSSGYEWKRVAGPGGGCFPANCTTGKFPMAIEPITAFGGRLFSVGDSMVWTSENGTDWASRPKTNWGERHGKRFAFFQDKIWMTGGMRTWDDFRNDVWSSSDGVDWRHVVSSAPWAPRRGQSFLVFKDKLWLIGGEISSGQADKTPTVFHSDVWSSDNGVRWIRILERGPWRASRSIRGIVFDDEIWMIDGDSGVKWTTADGQNWKLVGGDSPWKGRSGHAIHAFDQKLWIFGGIERNDVWSSPDGQNWRLEFDAAPWSKRSTVYSAVYSNKLWIFSGKTGRDDSWEGDVWAMSRMAE